MIKHRVVAVNIQNRPFPFRLPNTEETRQTCSNYLADPKVRYMLFLSLTSKLIHQAQQNPETHNELLHIANTILIPIKNVMLLGLFLIHLHRVMHPNQ